MRLQPGERDVLGSHGGQVLDDALRDVAEVRGVRGAGGHRRRQQPIALGRPCAPRATHGPEQRQLGGVPRRLDQGPQPPGHVAVGLADARLERTSLRWVALDREQPERLSAPDAVGRVVDGDDPVQARGRANVGRAHLGTGPKARPANGRRQREGDDGGEGEERPGASVHALDFGGRRGPIEGTLRRCGSPIERSDPTDHARGPG